VNIKDLFYFVAIRKNKRFKKTVDTPEQMKRGRMSVNTEQAFALLKSAGVSEDISIQTVRRWLREKKINYEGRGNQKSGYILDDTDQAYHLLKDAGVAASIGIPIVRRWLREGKIQDVGSENSKTEYITNEMTSKQFLNNPTEQDKMIRQLKVKIKAQEEQIKGLEELHQNSIKTLVLQREKLNKEIAILQNEKNNLQSEAWGVLKENIDLRNELLKLKEELYKGTKSEPEKQDNPPITQDFRQKLGLSKSASHKEILAGYKRLLKITHPDQGGNARAFHYIKTDFDFYRNSLKG
jgi:predicted site-specific integrase-resolvase